MLLGSNTRSSANVKRTARPLQEILKGNPKYIGASLTQGHAHLSSGCGFTVGLGKPKLYTKFELPSFSHCVNIEGEPPNFGELPWPMIMPSLSSACDIMMGLGKPQQHAKFEVASPISCRNTIGEPQKFEKLP